MASTNPFHRVDSGFDDESGESETSDSQTSGRRRGADRKKRLTRKNSRGTLRRQREFENSDGAIIGWPAFEGLRPVLLFLSVPAVLVLAITLSGGGWPKSILYPIALGLGLVLAISAFKGVELVLAVLLIYLPFSKVFVVPLAPGVNGTNMLILLGLFAAILRSLADRQKLADWPAGSWLVVSFGAFTALSAFTITLLPGGRTYFLYSELLSYKAWIDQFIFYFILLTCIRDVETAKRCVIYMMIGSVLVVLYSVPEMLDKMGRSTIDKSRIGGPHLQSNNFGGFVAYTLCPLIAFFVIYIKDLRAWLLAPYFLLTLKVLITTFSRGAYLAILAGGLVAGWFRGKAFLAFWMALALSFFLVFPQFIPASITARMESLTNDESSSAGPAEDKLDKSSSTRLIMWRAAGVMIMEDPFLGKGFKGFPYLKDQYTETPVEESDPHSMYLYLGAQMGLPALALFLMILAYNYHLGRKQSRIESDQFLKAVGIGGASATACFAVVCIFGSRAVSLNFTVYFWTYMVVMQVIGNAAEKGEEEVKGGKRARRTARNLKRETVSAGEPRLFGSVDAVSEFDESTETATEARRSRKSPKHERKRAMRGAAAYQARQRDAENASSATPEDEPDVSARTSRQIGRQASRRSSNGFKRKG